MLKGVLACECLSKPTSYNLRRRRRLRRKKLQENYHKLFLTWLLKGGTTLIRLGCSEEMKRSLGL